MDNLEFRFKAYSENDKVIIHVKMDGAEAIFKYDDPEAVAHLAGNMKEIIEYAIDDYMLQEKFKEQLETGLDEWLKEE